MDGRICLGMIGLSLILAGCAPEEQRPTCGDSGQVCAPGETCFDGHCRAVCSNNADCTLAEKCEGDVCLPGAGECSAHADCDDPPAACREVPGTCEAGACSYATAEDGTQCQLEIVAGNERAAVCEDGECVVFCPTDGSCPEGTYCDDTYCQPKRPLGEPCDSSNKDASCESGRCVDGHCCDEACAGTCRSCDPAATDAAGCSVVVRGRDPDEECPGAPACDGAGACYAKGSNEPCAANFECLGGNCAASICAETDPLGTPCQNNYQCVSGLCVDDVCCDAACTSSCKSCLEALTGEPDGQCAPVPEGDDPENACSSRAGCNEEGACFPLLLDVEAVPATTNAYPSIHFSSDAVSEAFECQLKAAPNLQASEAPEPCSSPWRLGPLEDGEHTVMVRVHSLTNNPDYWVSKEITFTVDAARPVAWWRFDDIVADQVLDSTASANHGTIQRASEDAGPSLDHGVFGRGLRLTGNPNDFLDVPEAKSLATPSYTVEAWLRLDDGAPNKNVFYSRVSQDAGEEVLRLAAETRPSPPRWPQHQPLLGGTALPDIDLPFVQFTPKRFFHVALVRAATEARFYINGRQMHATSASEVGPDTSHLSDAALRIGAGSDAGFDGVLDEVRVFAYPRSADQIRADAAAIDLPLESADSAVSDRAPYEIAGSFVGGAPSWADGKVGERAPVLAPDGYIELGTGPATSVTERVSVQAWIRPDATGGNMKVVGRWAGNRGYELGIAATEPCPGAPYFRINDQRVCGDAAIAEGKWTHLHGVYDGEHLSLWTNFEQAGVAAYTGPIEMPERSLRVGEGFSGRIDGVRIHPDAEDQGMRSCQARQQAGVQSASGAGWVDTIIDGQSAGDALRVWCDMETEGGGWADLVKTWHLDGADPAALGERFFYPSSGTLDFSAAVNSEETAGILIEYGGASTHGFGIYLRPAAYWFSAVGLSYRMQGSNLRSENWCSTGYWVPLNGPGYDGGCNCYAAPCPQNYGCIQGRPTNDRDRPIHVAEYRNDTIDAGAQLLTWSGSRKDHTVASCSQSGQIPTSRTALFIETLLLR